MQTDEMNPIYKSLIKNFIDTIHIEKNIIATYNRTGKLKYCIIIVRRNRICDLFNMSPLHVIVFKLDSQFDPISVPYGIQK